MTRFRFWIAALTDRWLPGQCWADLVMWALDRGPRGEHGVLPWKPQSGGCRADAARCGRCYCGKVTAVPQPGETPQ